MILAHVAQPNVLRGRHVLMARLETEGVHIFIWDHARAADLKAVITNSAAANYVDFGNGEATDLDYEASTALFRIIESVQSRASHSQPTNRLESFL